MANAQFLHPYTTLASQTPGSLDVSLDHGILGVKGSNIALYTQAVVSGKIGDKKGL